MSSVRINGQDREIEPGLALAKLLESVGLKAGPGLIVEHNGKVVDPGSYADRGLADGDVLEIIRVMGGG